MGLKFGAQKGNKLGSQLGPMSITKLSPNWACQMGPIHCPKFLLPGTWSLYIIPTNVRLTLYYSLIYPYIAYCNRPIIWASNYKSRLYRLKILQKRSVRIIAGLPYNSHTDLIFKHCEILKFFQISLKQINEFMHRYSYNTLPAVFSNFFTPSAVHSYNTRNCSTIKHAFARTNSRKFSIRVAGLITWDELPRDIRSIPTLSLFKTKLNSWLIKCTQINVNYCPWLSTLSESFV